MQKTFKITRRHYDIIVKQAADNFPKETGGFLGGIDFEIKAIQPIFNQHMFNKTDTFGFTAEDIERAHRFFKKHGLNYYGLYHTHPSGVAYPSKQDIKTGHKYHFIIGIQKNDIQTADFRAYEIIRNQPYECLIEVVDDTNLTVVDIHNESAADYLPGAEKKAKRGDLESEAEDLSEMIENIIEETPQYKRDEPLNPHESDFSTLA